MAGIDDFRLATDEAEDYEMLAADSMTRGQSTIGQARETWLKDVCADKYIRDTAKAFGKQLPTEIYERRRIMLAAGEKLVECQCGKQVMGQRPGAHEKVGVSISAIARELANNECFHDYKKSVEFSEHLDKILHDANWLELYDGTTFERTFTPKH